MRSVPDWISRNTLAEFLDLLMRLKLAKNGEEIKIYKKMKNTKWCMKL